ncbi:OmpA family protein [Bosea sp. Root381]|uniref:OmpA family protein n=1 Tax=Bosea sp. Root381 TaxID=1736524 RepID=UPI000B250A67|nr:OmpA family protein [Bosea sp. Root381]
MAPAQPATPPQAAPAAPPAGSPPGAPPRPPREGRPGPGQTEATPPAAAPPVPGQPPAPDQRQGRRDGIGLGGAAAIGAAAGAIGGIMATQGADRIDDIRGRREERREGDVTIIREPGRTILRDGERTIIRRDETQRFRDLGLEGRTERRGEENRTVFERPDGTRIVTVTDADGRLIRRARLDRNDREVVIIDNTRRDRPRQRFSDEVVVLERPQLRIPRERYIVDAERADRDLIYETIVAPPLAPLPRRYTLDEVRYSPDLRARMRSVDIDTVTFESGSWDVAQGQAQRLQVIADSIRRALQKSPNEVFLVEGHTDAVGADIDNLSLSDRRAESVAEILTRDFAVPAENLTTQGYGEQYLKVATQEAERQNRRVTLRRITPLLAGQQR